MTDADRITVLEAQVVALSAAVIEIQAVVAAMIDADSNQRVTAAAKRAQRERAV